MRHTRTWLLALLALTGVTGAPTLARAAAPASVPEETALQSFRRAQDNVLAHVRSKAKASVIQADVDALLDYRAIAKIALGTKCAPRCADFESVLTKVIRQKYLELVRRADEGKIEYLSETVKPKASKVFTRVTVTKPGGTTSMEVAYVMRRVDGHWSVVDILTDGVSLVSNYRHTFAEILAEEGIDGVISRLQSQLEPAK
jgi:phospholipid transport system substrate-binding protein